MGWAVKKNTSSKRFSKHVKDYVKELFHKGEVMGQNVMPEQAAISMRRVTNEDGTKLFDPKDWLSAKQFQSQFSVLARVVNHSRIEESVTVDNALVEVMAILEEVDEVND
jgi:uncharacterized protein (DUF2267 family)